MTSDDIKDLAISIVNELVLNGHVPDCTDTDDETEFEIQDIIVELLAKKFNVNMESDVEFEEDEW